MSVKTSWLWSRNFFTRQYSFIATIKPGLNPIQTFISQFLKGCSRKSIVVYLNRGFLFWFHLQLYGFITTFYKHDFIYTSAGAKYALHIFNHEIDKKVYITRLRARLLVKL